MQSLSNIAQYLSGRGDIQIVLFFSARNIAAIDRFKRDHEWNYPIVHDIATAYKNLYGIEHQPVCILTNRRGVIQFLGIPGKASFSIGALYQVLSALVIQNKEETAELVCIAKRALVWNGDTVTGNWGIRSAFYSEKRKQFMFWNYDERTLYLLGHDGNVAKKVDIGSFAEKQKMLVSMPIGGNIGTGSIAFVNINYHIPAPITVFTVNPELLQFRVMFYGSSDSAQSPRPDILQLSDTTFLISFAYENQATLSFYPELAPARIVNASGEVLATVGEYEKYLAKYTVDRFYAQKFCLDGKGNIYTASRFSDSVRVYTQAGELLQRIPCDYDSTLWNYKWREYFGHLYESSPVEEFKKLSDSITAISHLFYDREAEHLYVAYSHSAPSEGGNTLYYVLHRPQKQGKTTRHDIALPNGVVPIVIENSVLYCMETIDNSMYLTAYRIPEWL